MMACAFDPCTRVIDLAIVKVGLKARHSLPKHAKASRLVTLGRTVFWPL